ncbi:MAG: fumarylacetoacetate hydrolase family protein [Dehalococcoidia bacterium]|nr:fumarylacetoacetate hydrolase family protein [Dehalococcoidia bacterium]
MKLARIQYQGAPTWGIVEKDDIYALEGDVYGSFNRGARLCSMSHATLLAPAEPSIIVACGLNYMGEIKHLGVEVPKEPSLFFKPATTVLDPGVTIPYPALTEKLSHEGELCCVMKKTARNVPEDKALDYVLGYTCGNDIGMMDVLKHDNNLITRAKGFDMSSALGPVLETDLDPKNLDIKGIINGEVIQHANTGEMLFSAAHIISYISEFMTLRAGDVVFTGTPENGHYVVKVGDVMEVEIENIGKLTTPVGPKA